MPSYVYLLIVHGMTVVDYFYNGPRLATAILIHIVYNIGADIIAV